MTNVSMPGSLKLALDHLIAVRELDRYLQKNGVEKDIRWYIKETLRPALEERIPAIKGWNCEPGETWIFWFPKHWEIAEDMEVSLHMDLPSPVDSDDKDPSVNLWVPSEWEEGQPVFNSRSTSCVKKLLDQGFSLAVEQHWAEDFPVGQYVEWLKKDGTFDESDLITRIAREAAKIVHLEAEITQAVTDACSKPVQKTPKGSGRRKPSRRKG